MIRPGATLLWLTAAWTVLAGLPVAARVADAAWQGWALEGWGLAGALLAAAFVLDAVLCHRRGAPVVRRQLPAAFSVQREHPVRLQLDNDRLPARFEVADHHPPDDAGTGLPRLVSRQPGRRTEVTYRYRPARRGTSGFGPVELWLPGPMGLCWRRWRIPAEARVPVYPDFSLLRADSLAARQEDHVDQGSRLQPRRGEGFEFLQLREYRSGDSLRQVDWKASARRRKLISREYQEEQNQQLIVLLDGGERLAIATGELTAFDHALNATLLLAWSAIRSGDRPGVLLFSSDEDCWVPPTRGQGAVRRLLSALYPLHPSSRASDFSNAAGHLLRRWNRHALVVMVTRLHPDDEEELMAAVALLRRRHLLLIADVELPAQAELAHSAVETMEDALTLCADANWQERRRALHTRLRHAGATVIDATPEHLPARLNHLYLALKRSGAI